MKIVTIDNVLSWEPCDPPYIREYVTSLFAGRETITALDILDMDIPPEDKLWAVLREDMIPTKGLHEIACRCNEEVLPLVEREYPTNNRPRRATTAWVLSRISDIAVVASAIGAKAEARAAVAFEMTIRKKEVEIVRHYLKGESWTQKN